MALTPQYNHKFYFGYFLRWPEYNIIAESLDGRPIGYGTTAGHTDAAVMGKCEGQGKNWHGHVTVLTVAPAYRHIGVARKLMEYLECVSEQGDMYFVDLFVRMSNKSAVGMYEGMGYSVYRRVLDYYCGPDEDAYGTITTPHMIERIDMRKALRRDRLKDSVIPLPHPVHASDLDY